MRAKCAVTFEFVLNPPLTWRGEIIATAASTIVSRAVKQAKKELKPNNWSSLVVVILERDNTKEDTESED
jgi:hypothetical protein